jgi:hypothetical protein
MNEIKQQIYDMIDKIYCDERELRELLSRLSFQYLFMIRDLNDWAGRVYPNEKKLVIGDESSLKSWIARKKNTECKFSYYRSLWTTYINKDLLEKSIKDDPAFCGPDWEFVTLEDALKDDPHEVIYYKDAIKLERKWYGEKVKQNELKWNLK